MPLVSIITPTYERSAQLQRTIESVVKQTLGDFEYIIVDDGSREVNTEEIVTEIDDSRISCIIHDENRGAAAARNTGIEAASGKYVAFLDSDDYWKPTKLEKQVEELKNGSHSQIGVYCQTEREQTNSITGYLSTLITDKPTASGSDNVLQRLIYPNAGFAFGSTLIVERDALDSAGIFDESLPRYEEIELVLRLLEFGEIGCVKEPLAVIGSSSYPSADAVAESNRRFVTVLQERYADRDINIEAAIRSHNFLLARCYFRDGRFSDGIRLLRRSRPHTPSQYLRLLYGIVSGVKKRTLG